jgi:ATP-binding cassette subfamily A (ABC1) protein 3
MNHGEIKCCGTPSFLKDNFGLGYRLTINKGENFSQYIFSILIEQFFQNYVIETNIAAEMCIALSVYSNSILIEFLNKLEEYKLIIGIDSYGISSTTIEEVFLK